MSKKLITIGETAKLLGVSIDTLRRWDSAGRLISIRTGPTGHRFYRQSDITFFLSEMNRLARNWAESSRPIELDKSMHCQTRDVFQARLESFQNNLSKIISINAVSLIIAITGEIGNNSFDHNLGNWPDEQGIFFYFDIGNRKVALADRGLGVLTTLKRVRPELKDSEEAIKVAFTETISGRYPEARGNGLKFVRSIVIKNPIALYFKSGNAQLYLKENDQDVLVENTDTPINGCLAIINFEEISK